MSTQMLPAPPKPPTMAEIQAMLPGLKLYNPSEEWLPLEVHGRTDLWLSPDLGGAVLPHRVTGKPVACDGILEVRGRYLTQKDSSGKTIEGQDAHAVVSYLIHKDRYGEMGVVWLPGRSLDEDATYRQYGRDKFLAYQQDKDDKIINSRREFKNNWDRDSSHKGSPCPPPTPVENAAMRRLDEREHKAQYQFECPVAECPGYADNDWNGFHRHMVAAHKMDVKRDQYEGAVGVVSAVKAPVAGIAEQANEAIASIAKATAALAAAQEQAADLRPRLVPVPKASKGKKKGKG